MSRLIMAAWSLYHWLLLRVDPTHPISLALRAEKALSRQAWGEAFDLGNQALRRRADFAPAYFARGVARLHLDDYGGALHDLNHFLRVSEDPMPSVYYWRGWIYAQKEEWSLALADFERIMSHTPDDPQLHYWQAYIRWQRGEWERMRQALDRLETLRPGSPLAAELRGHLLLHEGDYEAAEQAYSAAMEAGWENPDLRYNRAVARRQLGRHDEARRDIEAIFGMDPENQWAHLEMSNFAFSAGNYSEALDHARRAIKLDRSSFEARLSEAATLIAMESHAEARRALEEMMVLFPDEPLVGQLYGDVLAESEEPAAATASYRRALTLQPDNHTLRVKLAGELIALEAYDEAAAELDQVLAEHPDCTDAYATRADLFRYNNEPVRMRADLERLLELEPDHAWALAFRAAHRHWEGDLEGAVADYDAALDADGGQGWLWAFRGTFHLRCGDAPRARDDFQRAITLQPEDPWIRRQWAEWLFRASDAARAREVLEWLVDDHPDDGFARLFCAELWLLEGEWGRAEEQLAAIVADDHELTWLAHAALAVLTSGPARQRHLALADEQRPEPTYWGMSPALVLAQRALVGWLRGEPEEACRLLLRAREALEPGERLWLGLRPLLDRLEATPLLDLLDPPRQSRPRNAGASG